ncbi:MAG: hypothetical protein ACRDO4_03550 [Nocardioides sp.]
MSRKLFLHIGLQKTGTSYLQSVFWQNKLELRAQGLDMVPGTLRRTFWLMLDVRGRVADFDAPHIGRSLERLPRQLAAATGPRALTTEESLASATPEQIERLLAACGDREIHVVITVRDLARLIPSSWQQSLQAGSHQRLGDHLDRLRDSWTPGNDPERLRGLWQQKNAAAVAARWACQLPAERIHIVTVPPSGSPPDELLRRFCQVLDVDHTRLTDDRTRPNEALSHVAAELLRRVNQGIDPALIRRDIYGAVGKRYFAIGVLGDEEGNKIRLPLELEPWCRSIAEGQVAALRAGGYQVFGDLDDLLPVASSFSDESVEPTDAELVPAATRALSHLLSDQLVQRREEKEANQAAARAEQAAQAGQASRAAGDASAGRGGTPERTLAVRARGVAHRILSRVRSRR